MAPLSTCRTGVSCFMFKPVNSRLNQPHPRAFSQKVCRSVVAHSQGSKEQNVSPVELSRRQTAVLAATALTTAAGLARPGSSAAAEGSCVEMPALKGKGYCKPATVYADYELTPTGLQFKDYRIGEGEEPVKGDRVVVDWDGYTIGYFGRIIQAKNLSKGGAFEGNMEGFLRFTLGDGSVIPAFEEAIAGMKPGGIRRIIVPPGPLSYPNEKNYLNKIGPVPTTLSGKNALGFVVVNDGAIDKTLLFDIELCGVGPNASARRSPGTWVAGPLADNK